jgi:hypothetical protein
VGLIFGIVAAGVSIGTTGLVVSRLAGTAMPFSASVVAATGATFVASAVIMTLVANWIIDAVEKKQSVDGSAASDNFDKAFMSCAVVGTLLAGLPTATVMMKMTGLPFGMSFGVMVAAACASTALIVTSAAVSAVIANESEKANEPTIKEGIIKAEGRGAARS